MINPLFTTGDTSSSTTLTDEDHLYPAHVNEVRTAINNSTIYNVKDYGALGDNSTNDTSAIQSAIDDMATGEGGVDGSGTNPLEISTPVSIIAGGNGSFTWSSASTSGVGMFIYSASNKTQFRKTPTIPLTPNDFPNGERYLMGHIVGNF